MPKRISHLLFSVLLCLGVGIIGSFFTTPAIPGWYQTLNKPTFAPPNWVFAPVWTTLYIMMGVSLYLVLGERNKTRRKTALYVFAIQLVLNASWSMVFFGLQSPLFAFFNIIALWLTIAATIKVFYPISRIAAYLLIPYFLWVTFASFLNLSIVLLN